MRGEIDIANVIYGLERHDMLPAIVFRTSRSQCDVDAERAGRVKGLRLAPDKQRAIRQSVHEIIRRYDIDPELITTHPQYSGLIISAVGAHHAGQLLVWRLLLEELMAAGQLRVLVATGTVAAGVDFPARTVVITAHSKRGADGFNTLTSAEFQQMSGRAGRRGRDSVGFCIAAPAPFCDARALLKLSKKPPEPLRSAYFPSPSTVLNLLRYRNVDDLRYTVDRSLAAFNDRKEAQELRRLADKGEAKLDREATKPIEEVQGDAKVDPELKKTRKRFRRMRKQADELDNKQSLLLEQTLHGLSALGYVDNVSLSDKGFWAARLCTSVVLELGEIIESGILDGVSAERMVAIIAAVVGESYRGYLTPKQGVLDDQDIERLTEIIKRVGKQKIPGVQEDRPVLPDASYTAVTWMHATDWQEFRAMLFLTGVSEGDVARLLTQTAEQLNQITRLTESHPQIALRAEECKRRLLRPPLTDVMNLDVFS